MNDLYRFSAMALFLEGNEGESIRNDCVLPKDHQGSDVLIMVVTVLIRERWLAIYSDSLHGKIGGVKMRVIE